MYTSRASGTGISRYSIVEEEHAGLERPNKSAVAAPAGKKAFRAKLQPRNFLLG